MESDYVVDRMTRRVPLTGGFWAIVSVADFRSAMKCKWRASSAGRRVYAKSSKKPSVYLHRVIAQPAAGLVVDHINGDTLDCRRQNLRVVTNAQNVRNQQPKAGRYKGVTPLKSGRWVAQIMADYRNHHLGVYATAAAAAHAYDEAARRLHGSHARPNFEEVTS